MPFSLQDSVRWTSQAAGFAKAKEGPVYEVVPAGRLPDRERCAYLYTGPGVAGPRNHESYVVKVGSRLYWPRVSALRLAGVEAGQPRPLL